MESRPKEVKTIEELTTLVKTDLATPRLTKTIAPDNKDFAALSKQRINDFELFASAEIDKGEMKIFIQFRESEFPRTTLGEAKTAKMDARFPLPGEPGEDPSRYGVTPGGHAIRKAQFRCNLPNPLTDEKVNNIIKESIATIQGTWALEQYIRTEVEVTFPFKVILRTQNQELYDVSHPYNDILNQHVNQKAQLAKKTPSRQSPDSSRLADEKELEELKNDLAITQKGITAREKEKGYEKDVAYQILIESRPKLQDKIKKLEEKLNRQQPQMTQTQTYENELKKLQDQIKQLDTKLLSPKHFDQTLIEKRMELRRKIKELEEKLHPQQPKNQTPQG